MVAEALIDANLLVLLVVGAVDPRLIQRNKRTRNFTPDDYELLLDLIGNKRVLVTPNTLTEASNLLTPHPQFAAKLRRLIEGSTEETISSADAVESPTFPRLGLTDAVLLEIASSTRPLITVDLDLYLAAQARGHDRAINFTHLRNL